MNDADKLIKVYTGSEFSVFLLKELLDQNGISALIRNDFNSAISAGFAVGVPSAIDVYVQKADRGKAESVIEDFRKSNADQKIQ